MVILRITVVVEPITKKNWFVYLNKVVNLYQHSSKLKQKMHTFSPAKLKVGTVTLNDTVKTISPNKTKFSSGMRRMIS